MFHLEQFDVCEDLRSTGITRLLCYSGLHPRSVALCLAPCHGRHPYSTPIRPRGQEPSRISLACCRSQCVARCRRRPRGGRVAIGCRFPSVVCGRSQTIDLSQRSFGATYRIQLLSLHLATFPPLLASDSGRLTRPSPVGFPPTGLTNHFQVHGYRTGAATRLRRPFNLLGFTTSVAPLALYRCVNRIHRLHGAVKKSRTKRIANNASQPRSGGSPLDAMKVGS